MVVGCAFNEFALGGLDTFLLFEVANANGGLSRKTTGCNLGLLLLGILGSLGGPLLGVNF